MTEPPAVGLKSPENGAEKTKSVLEVAAEPYPLDPGALYLENMKGHLVKIAVGRDSLVGQLVHVSYKAEAYFIVSHDKHQIEYGKTWRLEDLTLIPAAAVRGLTLLEPTVHKKEITETTRSI